MKGNEYLESYKIQVVRRILSGEKVYLERIDNIKATLEKIDASPSSELGKAKEYMLKRWDGFVSYLNDGHVEMTNNISERAVKPFVIARKNFLFSYTENGARSSAIYFSIQQTARANGLDPKEFVGYLLTELSPTEQGETLDKYMPWEVKKVQKSLLR